MSEYFEFRGWAFRWYQHTCHGITTSNLNKPKYSNDFQKVREIIYDESAEYCFHFRVKRLNSYIRLFIKAGLLVGGSTPMVYLSKSSAYDEVDPKEPYVAFDPSSDPSDEENMFVVKLYWPARHDNYHKIDTIQKFQVDLGWKSGNEADNIPPKFITTLPLINIQITDVIPNEG